MPHPIQVPPQAADTLQLSPSGGRLPTCCLDHQSSRTSATTVKRNTGGQYGPTKSHISRQPHRQNSAFHQVLQESLLALWEAHNRGQDAEPRRPGPSTVQNDASLCFPISLKGERFSILSILMEYNAK